MGGKQIQWSVFRHLRNAMKKIRFLLSFNISKWRLASLRSSSQRHRRLSFNDRTSLRDCTEDAEFDRSCSIRRLERMRSYAYSDEDIDMRAEAFISNFYKQLKLQKQVSMELRYCRTGHGSERREANSKF